MAGLWRGAAAAKPHDRKVTRLSKPRHSRQPSCATAVPEPQTWALMLGGIALLGALRRKR